MKTVTFILPVYTKPSGGYKVIYEYANLLCKYHFSVNIIFLNNTSMKKNKGNIYNLCKYIYLKVTKNYKPNWFLIDEKINFSIINRLPKKLDSHYIIATAATTAQFVNSLPQSSGKKYYFIQSYEDWLIDEIDLIKTWKMPMQKLVISKSLLKKAHELGEEATYIPNGLNHDEFFIDSSIEKEENTLMMLYHSNEAVKQSNKALEKLIKLKKRNPEIKLILFSTLAKPEHIPEWVEYHQLPSKELLRSLYNRATLFIAPSAIEGWALPPAEAMMCGTPVCVTKIDGHEYVIDGETGYLIKLDLSDLVEKIENILIDQKVKEIAENGNKYIKLFTWKKSGEKLIRCFEDTVEN